MTDPTTPDVACHLNVVMPDLEDPGLPAALDALAALGYARIVMPPLDPHATDARKVRRLLSDRGLGVVTIAGQRPDADVSSEDPGVRRAGAESLQRLVEFTADLGGDQMNGVPYGLFGRPRGRTSEETFRRAASAVGAVADYAHAHGVRMTFEVLNRYETSVVNTAEQAREFVAASGSDHLQIHLDTFHMAVEEEDLEGAIRHALPKLGYLEVGQSGRGDVSSGAVDLPRVLASAFRDGYGGRVGVEAFSRSVLRPEAGDMLAIWRSPYADGMAIAAAAKRLVDEAWAAAGASEEMSG
jgi:D-psicose/D-tagatose/L-ribulose 3-epimerase